MGAEHPSFKAVPAHRRWLGLRLDALFLKLQEEAKADRPTPELLAEDKGWSWRMLRRGAVVALRHRPDLYDRLELRLARVDAPTDARGWKAWDREVDTFLGKFGIRKLGGKKPCRHVHRDWYIVRDEPRDEGKATARLMELRKGETKPGKARCYRCWEEDEAFVELEWAPVTDERGQLCGKHRLTSGREQELMRAKRQKEGGFAVIVCTRGKGCRTVRLR